MPTNPRPDDPGASDPGRQPQYLESIWLAPPPRPPHRTAREALAATVRALWSLILLLGVLVGLPATLVYFVGWPLPTWDEVVAWSNEPPGTSSLSLGGFVRFAACLLWVAWAVFLVFTVVDVVAIVAKIRLPRPRLAMPIHQAVTTVLGGLVLATTATRAATPAAVVTTTAPADQPPTTAAPGAELFPGAPVVAGDTAVPTSPFQETRATAAAQPVYTVRRGDWMWHIAERFLGDPNRYTEIEALNPQYRRHAGYPDHIEATWQLLLPPDAVDRGVRRHATGTLSTATTQAAAPSPPGGAKVPPQQAEPDDEGAGTAPGAGPAHTEPAWAGPTPPTPATASPPQATTPSTPAPPGAAAAGASGPVSTSSAPTGQPSMATTAPAPSTSAPAPAASDADPAAAGEARQDRGIDLGEHGWVTVEVAAAVAAAAALLWIHRRRRYRLRPPGPAHRDDPDLTPLPRTVAALHHSRRTTAEDEMDASEPQTRDAALVTAASLGSHAGELLHLPDLPTLGVGLTGPGAIGAARGLLASVLSAGGPWTPGAEAMIITTIGDLHQILPDHDPVTSAMDRLCVTDTVEHALDELERHLLRRARIASDTADLATTLGSDEDQILAPTVFLASAPDSRLAIRLAAVLTVGARLALVGVVLGAWPTGKSWLVNPDGTTTVDGQSGPRLNILDSTAALEILDTVRQAHPIEDDLPPVPPRQPARPHLVDALPPHPPASATPPQSDAAAATAAAASQPAARTAGTAGRRLRLSVLGRPGIQAVDGDQRVDIRIRRKEGVQILVHLAVNPDGATSDQLMALLWPEVRPTFSRRQFHTTNHDLRQALAEAIGAGPIARTDGRYHLDPQLVEVDLWTLNATIDEAATAVDPAQHATALRRVIDLYTGPIADGHSWLWLAPYREATRRHVVDAYAALAEGEPEPRQALALIQDAIRLDPYNEDLYQHAMRLHARLGSPDGVRRTLRMLSEHLGELEVRISPQTQQVAAELIERLGIRQRIQHGPG